MKKADKKALPKIAQNSRSRAAGMAAATRGRSRVFKDKRTETPRAKRQIDEQLSELDS